MRTILHIVTRGQRNVAKPVVDAQKGVPDLRVEVLELAEADVDYDTLLEKIFAADSVNVW